MSETATRHIGIALAPDFALASFAMVIEPLRIANRLSGRKLYEWSLLSGEGGPVMSSAGIDLATIPVAGTRDTVFDLAMVCAGFHPERYRHPGILNWLRRHRRLGKEIGAVSTGTFILARAGLLDDHSCTVHWDYRGALTELYPHVNVTDDLYMIDRGIVTSAGSIAALDLMLRLIADQHSLAFSKAVGEQFIHTRARSSTEHQRGDLIHRLGTAKPLLLAAVKRMEEALDRSLSPAELARDLGISQRQMERQFKEQLGRTPIAYHRDLRLDQARRLLSQTSMPITEIALTCGFGSASHFAKLYYGRFGRLPNEDRI